MAAAATKAVIPARKRLPTRIPFLMSVPSNGSHRSGYVRQWRVPSEHSHGFNKLAREPDDPKERALAFCGGRPTRSSGSGAGRVPSICSAGAVAEIRLPNLILVGVGRAGTTSLFSYLGDHDEICPSNVKETHWFSPPPYGPYEPSIEQYASYFSHCAGERYLMEATPSYFVGGRSMIEAIQTTLSEPRIVVTLREPVSRLWSIYRFWLSRLQLPTETSFEDYVAECERLRGAGQDRRPANGAYFALSEGLYADYMADWLEAFGDTLRVVFFDDLSARPEPVVVSLAEWLDLDTAFAGSLRYAVENRGTRYRHRSLQRLAIGINRRSAAVLQRHPRVNSSLRAVYVSLNSRRAEDRLPSETAARLNAFYSTSNKRLGELLTSAGYGPLPPWLSAGPA